MIEPISALQEAEVDALTQHYVALAGRFYGRDFPEIDVTFDLRGSSVGMFRVDGKYCCIRYNPWLFSKYYEENLAGTVPHEVAHYVVHQLYTGRPRPHGREWLEVMSYFDADPTVTCDFDMAGIPQRRERRFDYTCPCQVHELSTRRHNNIQKRGARYQCLECGGELIRRTP